MLLLVPVGGLIWVKSSLDGALIPPSSSGEVPLSDRATALDRHAAPMEWPSAIDWRQLDDPDVAYFPWARWWWPGADVEPSAIASQLATIREAGFGGVEIQAFKVGMSSIDDDAILERVNAFASESFYRALGGAIDAASELGMQVDINHGSGWPAGGPQVSLAETLQTLQFTERQVQGPARKQVKLPRPAADLDDYFFALAELSIFGGEDFYNFPAASASLMQVNAYRVTGGERKANPLTVNDQLALQASSVIDLTDRVKDGRVEWDIPEGEWAIVATWIMPNGSAPILVAREHSGFVLDHLRDDVVLGSYDYLFGEETGLDKWYGRGFRGIFNDSLEFTVNRLATEEIFEQFFQRRGYRIEPYLASLAEMGADNFYFREVLGIRPLPEYALEFDASRIRYDYKKTISDLVIEKFVETSRQWAEGRGMTSRGQTYGMDLDVLRGLGANSIPETEQLFAGGGEAGLKLPAAAALLYGHTLVSAESFVWANRSHGTTPRKVKAAADKLFLSGVNHIIYHGIPYQWNVLGGEAHFGRGGWFPFSSPDSSRSTFSSLISPLNPMWEGFAQVNRYIARVQQLLRGGAPDIDVLIWYPFIGFPSSYGESPVLVSEPLANGRFPDAEPPAGEIHGLLGDKFEGAGDDHRVDWLESLAPVTESLNRRGYTWNWFGEHALLNHKLSVGRTESGARYQLLLVPNVERLSAEAAEAMLALQRAGQQIVLMGALPETVPGFYRLDESNARLRRAVDGLLDAGALHVGEPAALRPALASLNRYLAHPADDTKLRYLRRIEGDTEIRFIANQTTETLSESLQLDPAAEHWWFDPMSGDRWPVSRDDGEAVMTLAGYESRVLVSGRAMPAAAAPVMCRPEVAARSQTLTMWQVPELGNQLVDWRTAPQVVTREAPLRYSATVNLDRQPSSMSLDLGLVHGVASVSVNGHPPMLVAAPPFQRDIADQLVVGDNEIVVTVTQALRNHLIAEAEAGDTRYQQMAQFQGQYQAGGLMGPVVLRECAVSPGR